MKKIIRFFRKIITSISPKLSCKIMYKARTGKNLNLKTPVSFNDKINWLKLYKYPNDKFISFCADKILVREYLEGLNLGKYLVDLLYVWDNVEDINWDLLPNKFVLKCNHGSGYNYICNDKNKIDVISLKKTLKKWLNEDFGLVSGERHYSTISRKIFCEKYLEEGMIDLQMWCARGEILFIAYINDPHGKNLKKCYDENWNELDFVTSLPKNDIKINRPDNLNEAIEISKKISKDLIFVRIDFYILKSGELKFSELTFTPASGYIKWEPEFYDEYFGNLISW